jgi:ribosomal protein S18 acetylase RimI-like enzyme
VPSSSQAIVREDSREEAFIIRTIRAEELREVVNVLVSSYHQYHWAVPWNAMAIHLAELLELRRSVQGADFVVAERQGRFLGVALMLPMASKEDWPRRWASVRALAVIPEARRLGIARALLAACAERARGERATALCLHVASFMTAASQLALEVGFRRLKSGDFRMGEAYGLAEDQRVSMRAYALPLQ